MVLMLRILIVCSCLQALNSECTFYSDKLNCYPDGHLQVLPIFPTFSGILRSIKFVEYQSIEVQHAPAKWIIPSLNRTSFLDAPLTRQLILRNIGLRQVTCDVFMKFRSEIKTLNLANNVLEYFPSCAINNLNQLEELTLSENLILCIPEFSIPPSLRHLNLSYNKIDTLSSSMTLHESLENSLQILIVRGNKLRKLKGKELYQFPFLEKLDASGNTLEYINPASFQPASAFISEINLTDNRLKKDVWKCFQNLTALVNLRLSHNQLDFIDDVSVAKMNHLQTFDASHNCITHVGQSFHNKTGLLFISFYNNSISKISNIFSQSTVFCAHFELDISYNYVSIIDISLHNCTDCTFKCRHSAVREIHVSNTHTSTFRYIDISNNDLANIPLSVLTMSIEYFDGSKNPQLSTKSVLDYISMIASNSVHIAKFRNTSLFCDGISSIPIINVSSNLMLDLSDNCVPSNFVCHFRSFPSASKHNVQIYLDRNNMNSLFPCTLGVSVHTLSLKGNSLSFLNETYMQQEFVGIRYLDVADNFLTDTPDMLKGISLYNMSNNSFTTLPAYINCSEIIQQLNVDLSANNISYVNNIHLACEDKVYKFNIDFSRNKLKINPSISLDFSHNSFYPTTLMVNMAGNNIKDFSPAVICSHQSYINIAIDMSHNNMTAYPSCEFLLEGPCSYLNVTVDLSHNLLDSLPVTERCVIGKTLSLEVNYNVIKYINQPIASSSKLRILKLKDNRIEQITGNAFDNVPYINVLDLSYNNLEHFPISIRKLQHLKLLNLKGNSIVSIPDIEYAYIGTIDLSVNKLRVFPVSIKKVTSLNIMGNKITNIPNIESRIMPYLTTMLYKDNPISCSCSMIWLQHYNITTDAGRCIIDEAQDIASSCLSWSTCDQDNSVHRLKTSITHCSSHAITYLLQGKRLSWTFKSNLLVTTPKTETQIEILMDCETVSTHIQWNANTFDFPTTTRNQYNRACITLLDESWIHPVTECLALHFDDISDEKSTNADTSDDSSHGKIVAILIPLFIVFLICFIVVFIYMLRRRRETNMRRNNTLRLTTEHTETSFSSPEDGYVNDKPHQCSNNSSLSTPAGDTCTDLNTVLIENSKRPSEGETSEKLSRQCGLYPLHQMDKGAETNIDIQQPSSTSHIETVEPENSSNAILNSRDNKDGKHQETDFLPTAKKNIDNNEQSCSQKISLFRGNSEKDERPNTDAGNTHHKFEINVVIEARSHHQGHAVVERTQYIDTSNEKIFPDEVKSCDERKYCSMATLSNEKRSETSHNTLRGKNNNSNKPSDCHEDNAHQGNDSQRVFVTTSSKTVDYESCEQRHYTPLTQSDQSKNNNQEIDLIISQTEYVDEDCVRHINNVQHQPGEYVEDFEHQLTRYSILPLQEDNISQSIINTNNNNIDSEEKPTFNEQLSSHTQEKCEVSLETRAHEMYTEL